MDDIGLGPIQGLMFQTYDSPQSASETAPRVAELRRCLAAAGLDAVLVPRADEFQGEYVPPSSDRLRWLTGFSGSAGLAVVAAVKAVLLVDGRYIVQAPLQVDTVLFDVQQAQPLTTAEWLIRHLPAGAKVGFDPWLHTIAAIESLAGDLEAKAITLIPTKTNLVDAVWGKSRPKPPVAAVIPHPIERAGVASDIKITSIQKTLAADGQDACVLTQPDSICWLLNIRGGDVAHNPIALAFALVPKSGKPELFIDAKKIGANVRPHIAAVADIHPPKALATRLAALKRDGRAVRLDPASAAFWFKRALGPKALKRGSDPCLLPKARKNAIEIAGTRTAHERDGVAMTRFLAWLDAEAPKGHVDEIGACRKLEALRTETGLLKEISFDTISGAGPNGAIVHYRVTEATNRRLGPGELFLLDSGAQYSDGTTDITRTIAIGTPTDEMRQRFTLVLKGHIAVATAVFPKATPGIQIDAFARQALWQSGFDYDHGTGHGVGSFLSVHEGPQSISRRGQAPLEPGMIVSNEPGYYREGAYGIRIENLLVVTEPAIPKGGERAMMTFETITLAPIDRRLVVAAMLSPAEREWLNAYHARVDEVIGPHLTGADKSWLTAATAPIG